VTSCDGLLRQKIGKRWRFDKDAIDGWVKRGRLFDDEPDYAAMGNCLPLHR
jgi:hypothetical protein